MRKRIMLLVVVAFLLIITIVFSVFLIKAFASTIRTYNLIIQNYRDTGASEEILKVRSAPRNEAIRNLVFVALIDVFFVFISFVALYFVSHGEIAENASHTTRYTYEQYCSRREAKRAERQEKKRQRLQEKLERISKGHESEP